MKKRITLPKEFRQLLEKGDMESLKEIYQKCDVNARPSKYSSNAFAMTPLPKEFAFWLKEQGADINAVDHYGDTPLFHHCSVYNGNAELLITLGANVNALRRNKETPLHQAARYCRIQAAEVLLRHGADVNARHEDQIWKQSYTPMETALLERRFSLDIMREMCELLLANGAEITDITKNAVAKIGKEFEFQKSGYTDLERQMLHKNALEWFYETFEVPPAVPISIHDGVSPIIIKATEFEEQYKKLWEYLVPPSGCAKTAQGEVIRIVGKVCHEILDNGGTNWDIEFKKMLGMLLRYFNMGHPLSESDIVNIQEIIKASYYGNGGDSCHELTPYAVKWVLQNQTVIPIIPPTYTR